jgi:hypothetical protein
MHGSTTCQVHTLRSFYSFNAWFPGLEAGYRDTLTLVLVLVYTFFGTCSDALTFCAHQRGQLGAKITQKGWQNYKSLTIEDRGHFHRLDYYRQE